jgi:hypothetical protein
MAALLPNEVIVGIPQYGGKTGGRETVYGLLAPAKSVRPEVVFFLTGQNTLLAPDATCCIN